jgi:hypothetical protein
MKNPPTVIQFGKREIISSAQFNVGLVADMISREGINEWLSISEIAKFVYGRSFLANNKRVRGYIWRLRKELIHRNCLLITEGRPVEHIKIFVDGGAEQERQAAEVMLRKMRTRNDFSADLYEKAVQILNKSAGAA